jgi:hypothetical protein
MSALPPNGHRGAHQPCPLCTKSGLMHCSNNAGLLGQVLPNLGQQFSFDTYFFPPASGKSTWRRSLRLPWRARNLRIQPVPRGNDSEALFHRHAGGRDSGGNVRRRRPWAWLYPNQGGLVRDWITPGEALLDEFDFRRCHLFVHFPLHFAI